MATLHPATPARGASTARVLVVEDDAVALDVTTRFIEELGAEVLAVAGVDEARDALGRGARIDLVVTDVKLRDGSGLDLLRSLHVDRPSLPVILITAYGNTEQAVAAMKEGACYYFTKPVDLRLLARVIQEALEKQALQAQVEQLTTRLMILARETVIGSSRAIQEALEQATAVGPLDTTVLIVGETGTGKELFAEFLHRCSRRASRPLVAINCAALPEALLESELFGHERGAFTGAVARKPGKFELADGGTLLLDEIADLAPALQGKLLRILETKQVEPLGATRPVSVDVRVIAATNRDLRERVAAGAFREDLFYRLDAFPITLPPLRERSEDISLLAAHFLRVFAREHGKQIDGIAPGVFRALHAYAWPGNVRELRHAIERAVILAPGPFLLPEHLPARMAGAPSSPPVTGDAGRPGSDTTIVPLKELERRAVLEALRAAGGNRTRAATALGITRNQIRYFLRNLPER